MSRETEKKVQRKMVRLFFFCILFSFLTVPIYPAPVYGTRMPQKGKFFGGIQTHNIFKRYLEDEYGKLRSLQHFFLLSYGVFDWLSIDLKGGAGYIKQHPLGSDEVDYPTAFAGGYGFRMKFYEKDRIKMVVGFQHISVHPQKIHLQNVKNKGVLDDWQMSLLASYEFKLLTPYLGIKGSRVDYIHWVGEDRKRKMSDLTKSIGVVIGFDLPLNEKIWFNLEGQFLDGNALAFSVNFRL
jgi:nitrate reductase NapE component